MTDLRKLLIEARSLLKFHEYEPWRNKTDQACGELVSRIDAALTEKVEPYGYVYITNNTWTHFTTMKPPDDAYDEGSLVPVYAAPADQDRVDAERWRMAKSLAVVRKSGRKLYKTDDPIPSYRLLRDADFGVIKPEINEEYEVCLFACIGETSIPEMDAMMDYTIDRARSAK